MTTLILNFSFYFYGEWYGILVETTLRFVGWFGTTSIFTMLILPIHKYKRPLHHLLCSLNSLFGVLNFSVQRSFTCLVIFIPTWFLNYCEWNCLPDFFLSYFVYVEGRHIFACWFYILILCWKYLLILRFLVQSLGLMYKIIVSVNSDNLLLPFLFVIPFYMYIFYIYIPWVCLCLELYYPLDYTFHQYESTLCILTNFGLNSILITYQYS